MTGEHVWRIWLEGGKPFNLRGAAIHCSSGVILVLDKQQQPLAAINLEKAKAVVRLDQFEGSEK